MSADHDKSPAWHETMVGLEFGCPPAPAFDGVYNPHEVSVVQFMRPRGAKRMMRVNVGKEDAQRARDAYLLLSAENLGNGTVAIWGRRRGVPEEEEYTMIATNGPGPDNPTEVVRRMIRHLVVETDPPERGG